jgi:hypothetical protein
MGLKKSMPKQAHEQGVLLSCTINVTATKPGCALAYYDETNTTRELRGNAFEAE